jgi:hypothetical protein
MFTRGIHWSLSWAKSVRSIPPHPIYVFKIHFNVIIPPTSRSSYWSLSVWLSHQNSLGILLPPASYMPCPTYPPYTKLLVMQFSPTSYHFIPLLSKYSQHPVFDHPPSVFLPTCQRPSFTHTHKTIGKIIVLCILIFTFLYGRREEKRFWLNGSKHWLTYAFHLNIIPCFEAKQADILCKMFRIFLPSRF